MSKIDTPEFLRLKAETIRCTLPDLCRQDGWSMGKVLRVARAIIHDEDLEGKPAAPRIRSVTEAMEMLRCEHRAAEPDYPKGARERHQKEKEKTDNFLSNLLRKKAKALTPEQQERIDAFKHELTEIVDAILSEDCGDTALELSEEESTVISKEMSQYIDELLPKEVDHLESEDSKNRIGEQVAEYVRDLIQKAIDERGEGA